MVFFLLLYYSVLHDGLVSDTAVFVLKRDVKLQLTNMTAVLSDVLMITVAHMVCNNEIDKSQSLETAVCLTTLGYFIFNWPSFSRFCQKIGW